MANTYVTMMMKLTSCYDDKMDCRASCCWGCRVDHVEANVAGGSVCWSCLKRLIMRFMVCSVARSFPAHNIYIVTNQWINIVLFGVQNPVQRVLQKIWAELQTTVSENEIPKSRVGCVMCHPVQQVLTVWFGLDGLNCFFYCFFQNYYFAL